MVFVTTEIGCNWLGHFTVLENIIRACKLAGVDAVKFQALSPEILSRHNEIPGYKNASINYENISQVDTLCKKYNLEWYATVTYPEAVTMLDPYVNKYKIRSKDNENKKLKDVCFNTGKTVFISSTYPHKHNSARIKNLYCIPKYPTTYADYNFNLIKQFDGFSSHCLNPLAILTAVEEGAKYIEFHVTPTQDIFIIDNKVSLSFIEMIETVKWIRKYESWNNITSEIDRKKISKQNFLQD